MTLNNAVTMMPDQTEHLVRRAIGCCLAVHRELGPGMSEAVYSRAVAIELTASAIYFEAERPFPVRYRGHLLCHQRVDLYLEQRLVLEIKAVEQIHPVHIAQAVSYLTAKKVSRIILARPAVEAGERLGFLPGDLQEKVNPYLRPLYDALYDMIDTEKATRLVERGTIEVAPIAFMRGRTLNDAFVILDEAQNTTSEQMKMFLTRLGFGSKAVVTGDITQIDLPNPKASGLIEALRIVKDIEGIGFVHFDDRDVVRHKLVQAIVKAYDSFSGGSGQRSESCQHHRRASCRQGGAHQSQPRDHVRRASRADRRGARGTRPARHRTR